MKKEKIFFLVFLILLAIMAYNDYYHSAKNSRAINLDIALSFPYDFLNSYEDLKKCEELSEEIIKEYDYQYLVEFEDNSSLNKNYLSLSQSCNAYRESIPLSYDIYKVFFTIVKGPILYYVPFFLPLILLFFSLFNINKLFKSKYAHYYIQRKSYKKFINKVILTSYKYALGVPLLYIFIYVLTLTITNHYPVEMSLGLDVVQRYLSYVSVNGFWILYGLSGFFFSLFIINLGLIFLRFNSKFIFTIIESYIAYFFIADFDELFQFGAILNFSNYSSSNEITMLHTFICLLVYFIITFIIVMISYSNKEKVLNILGGNKI